MFDMNTFTQHVFVLLIIKNYAIYHGDPRVACDQILTLRESFDVGIWSQLGYSRVSCG